MYTVVAVQCGLPRGRRSRAELMHCLACATLSEAQGSVESREACITPSEVDKVHQWPIYSTVQYQASSPPAKTQWQHERVFVCVSVMPIKTKIGMLIQELSLMGGSERDGYLPLRQSIRPLYWQNRWEYLNSWGVSFCSEEAHNHYLRWRYLTLITSVGDAVQQKK